MVGEGTGRLDNYSLTVPVLTGPWHQCSLLSHEIPPNLSSPVMETQEDVPQVYGLRESASPAPCVAGWVVVSHQRPAVETGGHVVASLLRQRASSAVLAATNVAWFGVAVVIVMVVVEALAAAAPLGPHLVGWPAGCKDSPEPCLAVMARCGLPRQAASLGVVDPVAGGSPA